IKHVTATVTDPESDDFVYTGSNIVPQFSAASGTSIVPFTVKYKQLVNNQYITVYETINAGYYIATVEPTNTNYSLGTAGDNGISHEYYYAISPKQLLIVADTPSLSYAYDGNAKNISYFMTDVLADLANAKRYYVANVVSYTDLSDNPISKCVEIGTYKANINVTNANYFGSAQFNMVINPRVLTSAQFDIPELVYNAKAKELAIDPITLPDNYDFEIEYKYYLKGKEIDPPASAGTYTVTAIIINPYYATCTVEREFTIEKSEFKPTVTSDGEYIIVDYIEGALYSINGSEFQTSNRFKAADNIVNIKVQLPESLASNYTSSEALIQYKPVKSFSYITLLVVAGIAALFVVALLAIVLRASRKRKYGT
ncbi:MAG: MBG domain-containing protein, partial [Christensenellaceae bacterium]|nr:MBG domain-containing protein [Christensenellaceae bacterium]